MPFTPDPNGINLRPVPSIWDEWASTWLARINIQGLKLMPFPPDPFSFPFLSGGVRLARGRMSSSLAPMRVALTRWSAVSQPSSLSYYAARMHIVHVSGNGDGFSLVPPG